MLNFMKLIKLLVLTCTLLFSFGVKVPAGNLTNPETSYVSQFSILDDGNYKAIVEYHSHTGYSARYSLVVRIVSDRVVAIYFENGGSIHSGSNNSDYTYSGGELSVMRDILGNVTGLTGTVTIKTAASSSSYSIGSSFSGYGVTYTPLTTQVDTYKVILQ